MSTRFSSSSTSDCFLGVDGGGTKTIAVLTDEAGAFIAEGQSEGSNPLRVGLEHALSNIAHAIADVCVRADVSPSQIRATCVAIAGINHPAHFRAMKEGLDRELPMDNVELVTDARAALVGALDGHSGVVVIAGTGSIAIGVNEHGEEARSGGLGPILADEGSGYYIGLRALKAVASAFDGRSGPTHLSELVCRRLGVESAADLPGVVYSDGSASNVVDVASLAELVTEAARVGDEIARAILADAGEELARLAVSVIRRLQMRDCEFSIACVGSVFNASDYLIAPLRVAVNRFAPWARIEPPRFAPSVGAARLARERFYQAELPVTSTSSK